MLMNREQWLTLVAAECVKLFGKVAVAKYRVTCGWPVSGGLGRRRRVVGQCFAAECNKDGVHELFISPTLAEPLEVAGTLMHELAHVAAGVKAGHGKQFVRVCQAVGLTKGRPFSVMPGPRLEAHLKEVVCKVGGYPHVALEPKTVLKVARKSSTCLECSACGCKVRLSLKDLDRAGPPTCGCGELFTVEEE
jgi:hypothetical protein